jgi:hypothetical protein
MTSESRPKAAKTLVRSPNGPVFQCISRDYPMPVADGEFSFDREVKSRLGNLPKVKTVDRHLVTRTIHKNVTRETTPPRRENTTLHIRWCIHAR